MALEFLRKSIDPPDNYFANDFAKSIRPRSIRINSSFSQSKNDILKSMDQVKDEFEYLKLIMSISDVIHKPQLIEARKKLTTQDKCEILLNKLYELYDDNFHSIEMILTLNGVTNQRSGEDREFGQLLADGDLLELHYGSSSLAAKLTLAGKAL